MNDIAARALMSQAAGFHQRGDLAQAEQLYRQILSSDASHFAARHMMGVLRAQQGKNEEALEWIGAALALEPDAGIEAGALVNYGNVLSVMGRFAEALVYYERALAEGPKNREALNNRGSALLNLDRFEEALAAFDCALLLEPRYGDALVNRGNALRKLARPAEALQSYDRALAINSGHIAAQHERGNILWNMDRHDAALAAFKSVLAADPRHAGALNNLGAAQWALGQHDEALAHYGRALAVNPDFLEALNNRAHALTTLRQFDEALADCERSLKIAPGRLDILSARAGLLIRLKRYHEALESYRAILSHDPGNRYALGGSAIAALNLCDWPQTAAITAALAPAIAAGAIFSPFILLGYSDDKALQLSCARAAINDIVPVRPAPLWQGAPYRHDKIRIAYISSDFCQHPVPALIARLIELHDRAHFEVLGISTGLDDASALRRRIAAAFDHFHDVQGRSATQVARLLRQLEVDILIDLNGHTEGDSFATLGHRACPLQVSWLGFPATTGADFLDYVLADANVAPFTDQPFFTEQIVHLPDCYFPTSYQQTDAPPTRAEAGLPQQGFVFCCFNNSWKIRAPMFDVWMRLLQAVPDSVLWLLASNDDFQDNIRREAAARGVDPGRLIFAGRADAQSHLARQQMADLMLDTLPYNGHMTASDALWAGVPLVTAPGHSFASRVAASQLRALEMPELIAEDVAGYEALALKLARDPVLLASTREKMARKRISAPLFDVERLCRHVETAYRTMREIQQRGEAPRNFAVRAISYMPSRISGRASARPRGVPRSKN